MIERDIAQELSGMARWFPVVSLTGPRQSGKSTIVRSVFADYEYLNLENPEIRTSATLDPVGFIGRRGPHLIIDEAQYAPDLFSVIQTVSDERGTPGQYVLSGSQNFLLLKRIQQSLAGRVGMLKLLPLSYREVMGSDIPLEEFALLGGYPRIYNTGMPAQLFFQNYIATYIERDAGELLNVRNLAAFRAAFTLMAANAGQLLNVARLARDVGVSTATIRSWLSILESSYLVFTLEPYHANIRKRLTKTPKLYFYDTGLLCHALGITSTRQLLDHPMCGAVFENLVVAERAKFHLNRGEEPVLHFYRDDSKREVDLIDATDASRPLALEIKAGETYRDSFARHLRSVCDELGIPRERRAVVYRGSERYDVAGASVVPMATFVRDGAW